MVMGLFGSGHGRLRAECPVAVTTVPENHFRAESRGVLVVDRYSAYKAMSWVKQRSVGPGLLLGPCAAGLHPGGQRLAAIEDVGLGMAAADSRALPVEPAPVGGGERTRRSSGKPMAACGKPWPR